MDSERQNNSDRFLAIFSEVERFLRRSVNATRHDRFSDLVARAAEQNRLVRTYQQDLREFADLRNAIVHERGDGHIIAEPNTRALRDFTYMRDVLLRPPKVMPTFQRDVFVKQLDDTVGEAVVAMRESCFSQIPITSGDAVTAVLTSDTVSRWLAHESANDLVSLLETQIKDVLPHAEDPNDYAVISQNATLVDVLMIFEDFATRGRLLNAILVSSSGKPRLPLVGILNVYDLPNVLSALHLKRLSVA